MEYLELMLNASSSSHHSHVVSELEFGTTSNTSSLTTSVVPKQAVALPSKNMKVNTLPVVGAQAVALPSKNTQVDTLQDTSTQLDSLPAVLTHVVMLPAVDTQAYKLSAASTQVVTRPAVPTQVVTLPAIEMQVYTLPALPMQPYTLPAIDTQAYICFQPCPLKVTSFKLCSRTFAHAKSCQHKFHLFLRHSHTLVRIQSRPRKFFRFLSPRKFRSLWRRLRVCLHFRSVYAITLSYLVKNGMDRVSKRT